MGGDLGLMMDSILASDHQALLAWFARSNVLLAFDYDVTLAPIVPTPNDARMRATTRTLLARAARVYPCVVISGRALDDLTTRFRNIPVWYLFGNHGLEPPPPGTTSNPTHARVWAARLKRHLPPDPGLVIEDKRYSLTIHYREAHDKRRAIEAIERAVRELPDARALGGNEAVSLLPRGGANKGVALQQACRWFACDSAIYVGDDATDEDAFASSYPEKLLTIRVGRDAGTQASYHLEDQRDIDVLLQVLVDLRTADSSRGRAAARRTR
jgi:trehalose 6-phosphate phosphatase